MVKQTVVFTTLLLELGNIGQTKRIGQHVTHKNNIDIKHIQQQMKIEINLIVLSRKSSPLLNLLQFLYNIWMDIHLYF